MLYTCPPFFPSFRENHVLCQSGDMPGYLAKELNRADALFRPTAATHSTRPCLPLFPRLFPPPPPLLLRFNPRATSMGTTMMGMGLGRCTLVPWG